jgi:DNA polymerase III sliding clamp (beta) subunit (PCNA family)
LIISSSRDDKGAVADKILLDKEIEDLDVSYLINHFIKVLELVSMDQINLVFKDYNGYTICVLEDTDFNHIMFPME